MDDDADNEIDTLYNVIEELTELFLQVQVTEAHYRMNEHINKMLDVPEKNLGDHDVSR